MRGGALAPLVWAGLLAVLAIINAVWTTGNVIQGGTFAAAVGATLSLAVLLVGLSPQARRKGPPGLDTRPETVPAASLASVVAGLALGCFVFGFTFSRFFVYFGGGLLVAALGRLGFELRAQRDARRRAHADWVDSGKGQS
jgi:hypothetical protein